ncbi:hypothetical protein GEMRC1_006435 [Eukaryota sp. GEM-RC1]
MPDQPLTLPALRERLAKRAEEIFTKFWEQKILELDLFLEGKPELGQLIEPEDVSASIRSSTSLPSAETLKVDAGSKRRKTDEDSFSESHPIPNVPSNPLILDMAKKVKHELHIMCETVSTVKMFIQLNIPAASTGDNFGVSVQEDIIGELSRAEESAFGVFDSIARYHISRGKLISKVLKYPNVEDYRQAIMEIDEKEIINVKNTILEIRNNYMILRDLIHKNLDKLKMPRKKFSAASMY